MKKKFFSLILALVMVFSLALSVHATEASETDEPTDVVVEVEEVQEVADTVAPSQAEDATEAADSSEAATEAASMETTAPVEVETAKSGMSSTMIFCLVLIVFGLLIVTQSKNLNKIGKKMKKNKKKK